VIPVAFVAAKSLCKYAPFNAFDDGVKQLSSPPPITENDEDFDDFFDDLLGLVDFFVLDTVEDEGDEDNMSAAVMRRFCFF